MTAGRIIGSCKRPWRLSAEEFTRDLGGSFRSVRDTLVHIIGGEWVGLKYWQEPSHGSAVVANLKKQRDALFTPDACPDVAAQELERAEIEKEQLKFLDRVTSQSLKRTLAFRSRRSSWCISCNMWLTTRRTTEVKSR